MGLHAAVFNVNDFGADPKGKKNSLPAVCSAIAAARKKQSPRERQVIQFGAGTYMLSLNDVTSKAPVIGVREGINLTIQGVKGKTTLILPLYHSFMSLNSCLNAEVRNFIVDRDDVPVSQFVVREVKPKDMTFTAELMEGYGDPAGWFDKLANPPFGVLFDPATRLIPQGGQNFQRMRKIESLGNRLFRFTSLMSIEKFRPGDLWAQTKRDLGGGSISTTCSTNTLLEDITIYNSAGINFVQKRGRDLTLRRVNILLKPGSTQLVAAAGDGIHLKAIRGKVVIDGCTIERLTDDGINFNRVYPELGRVVSSTEIEIPWGDSYEVFPGDRIDIMIPETGSIRGRAKVLSVKTAGKTHTVRFDKPIAGMKSDDGTGVPDQVWINDDDTSFLVKNCTFRDLRGRGVLLRSGHVTLLNNVFLNISSPAIVVENDFTIPEGMVSSGYVFRGNRMITCGYDGHMNAGDTAPITIKGFNLKRQPAGGRLFNDFIIENNVITDCPGHVLSVTSAGNVVFRGNMIQQKKEWKVPYPKKAVCINNAENVIIAPDNKLNGRSLADQ